MKRILVLVVSVILVGIAAYLALADILDVITTSPDRAIRLGLFGTALFLLLIAIFGTVTVQRQNKITTLQNRLSMWTKLSYHVNQVGDEIFNELPIAMFALDDNLDIKWANKYGRNIIGGRMVNRSLEEVAPFVHEQITAQLDQFVWVYNDQAYDVIYKRDFQFIYMFLATKRYEIETLYEASIPTLMLVTLDYIDESLASLPVSEQSSLKGQYLGAIADWATGFKAYLQQLSDDRIILVSKRHQLKAMMEQKFVILDEIRKISLKHNVRVTLSMGIASWDTTFETLGVYAQNAIELAEKRGGDQVVVNVEHEKIQYFGASGDAQAKNSRVDVRIHALNMKQMAEESNRVYIMCHKRADLDALGSMMGMFYMLKTSHDHVKMLMIPNEFDLTAQKVLDDILNDIPEATSWFIDATSFQLDEEDMLVIVDTQSKKLLMAPHVLDTAKKIVMVDHHRAAEDAIEALISYVEPSASSASELVVELMTFYERDMNYQMPSVIASLMYGGIIVDTNYFSIRTSPRTFEVAALLKDFDADAQKVNLWLRKDLNRTLMINQMIQDSRLILNRFMILKRTSRIEDRVMLAQAAESALDIEGVDASFAFAYVDDNKVSISARSQGSINVQILMEQLGGGGHLTAAATQMNETSIEQAIHELTELLQFEYGGEAEDMKVILLEDVKGRGKQDDVIEVASGYGQFLLTQKKAVLASEESLKALQEKRDQEAQALEQHLELMRKLKADIDGKHIQLEIQVGQDNKLFGAVTTKHIVEKFEAVHGITLDKKKVELSSEINSPGIYTVTVHLHKQIHAQFEVHIVEK
jgi:cyclic-di-AMP phosphodiesterase